MKIPFRHEDGFPEIEAGNPIQRTRVLDPADVQYRTEDEIKARIDEFHARRETFDPKKHFTGLSRLGSSYTVAEPLALFDGPTPDQRKLTYALIYGGSAFITVVAFLGNAKIKRASYLTGLTRGLMFAPVFAWGASKFYDYISEVTARKNKILLHYALLHENDFPVIGMCQLM